MSPDSSKVAITDFNQQKICIWEITLGSETDVTNLIAVFENAQFLRWFPDSKRIAYHREYTECHSGFKGQCYDLVVQCPADKQSTTIHRFYKYNLANIFITADGSRLITQDKWSFMAWDVSDA